MRNKTGLRILLTALIVLFHFSNISAQFLIGHTSVTLIDSSRSNRSIPVYIFYPANDTSLNTPMATGTFPLFVFGHGLLMEWSVYDNVWTHLVPNGYIVALPATETTFGADFNAFGMDEAYTATALQRESQNPSSLFYGKVGTIGAGGHSMGGSAAILAVNKNQSIITTVGLASSAQSLNTFYSIPDTAATLTIPSMLFAATGDGMAPPATHQIPLYDSLKSSCKVLVNIKGGSHCQFAEPHTTCQTAEAGLGGGATISRAKQHGIIDQYLLPWLDYALKGNTSSWNTFANVLPIDTQVTYMSACAATGIESSGEVAQLISVYPNPNSAGKWQLEVGNSWLGSKVEVVDITGRVVFSCRIRAPHSELAFEAASGIYLLHLFNGQRTTSVKLAK